MENWKISGFAYEPGLETGSPLLINPPSLFEARITKLVPGGDHTVYVDEMISVGLRDVEASPLQRWLYEVRELRRRAF